jgi:hypothetical protein
MEMRLMLNNFLGKNVRIIDDDNMEWRGYVRSIETPEDSDDGQWWLDIVNVNKPGFKTGLSISEHEIKEISEVDNG